ncbi:XRE family transcriptional regulator [Leucobacter sp. UCMA 4100]|uniref:XRE family transcriptional regulator n=1 Tax=Leucobacter sp. UCMA 4100 TaxID=2810534 RepID=UPI0022EA427D|nr:XRE family transcriptional regulator [Leucobacter sp. UCMA 4100]MDA3147818.1 XRE family transcriptional regulator [Leucobacter sp. UCMA 4100]
MDDAVILTPDLARAARAFTKVSPKTIAEGAGLTRDEVRNFERGKADLEEAQKARLVESLEKYGALFIPEDEEAGYGVRRKFTRTTLKRLNTWEGEGGQPQPTD